MSLPALPARIGDPLTALQSSITTQLQHLHDSLPPGAQKQVTAVLSSPHLNRANGVYLLRAIVIVATYVLFRPHLEALLRQASGAPDPRRAELEARLRFLQDLKDGKVAPQGGVEVVDGKVVLRANPVKKAPAKGRGKGKVVKLVEPGEEEDAVQSVGKGGDARENGVADATATATPGRSTRRRKA